MATKLDTAVNVVTLMAALAILGTLATRLRTPDAQPAAPQEPFQVGERMPLVQGVNFTRAKLTLVMIVRQDCRYCEESMPFYRRLPRSQPVKLGSILDTQLIALMLDNLETARRYVSSNELKIDAVIAIPPSRRSDLRIKGTPTLLLVDGTGTIRNIWIGKLNEKREREVLDALTANGG